MSITFHVGTQGLETFIDPRNIYTDEEYWGGDLPANMTWEHVTVAGESEKQQWIAAKNACLEAAWTPNQDSDTRDENAAIIKKSKAEMAALEK